MGNLLIAELQSATFRMGSHIVTCLLTQVKMADDA